MAVKVEKNNLTIHGFHNKNTNRVGHISKTYPVIIDEVQSHFLVTRSHFFDVSTVKIIKIINNLTALESFSKIKGMIANIMIIPGLVISIAYILQIFGLFSQVAFIESSLSTSLSNLFFWLAVLGVVILWHDHFRTKTYQIKLPSLDSIPEKEYEEIDTVGFKFARYSQLDAANYLTEESINLLQTVLRGNTIKIMDMYQTLFKFDEVIETLRRADLVIDDNKLKEYSINNENIPDYPVQAVRSIVIYALEEALLTESERIEPIHFFLAISKVFNCTQKMFKSENSSINMLRGVVRYLLSEEKRKRSVGYFNPANPYYSTGGIARSWVYGYTFVLNHFSKDVNVVVSQQSNRFGIGHEKEVENLVSILGRATKKHALLIGEPGVGKSSLIMGVAQRINRGDVPPQLIGKRIVQLDINGLIAYSSRGKSMEETVQKAMGELAAAGNTILFIDEMQELIPARAQESGHSLAGVLLPYVLEGKFSVVGTVNYADYKKYFYTNESFRQSFGNIEVTELSVADTVKILESKIASLEEMFRLYITYPAIVASAELAQRYVNDRMLPDSAVNVLEAACSWAQANSVTVLTGEHIAKSVSMQTNIAVESVTADEADKLMALDEKINKRVVGQDEAVNVIVEALRRSRAGVRSKEKPIGVFLFIGPTGVGKTYLAKVLAEEFFENKEDIIRLDMSEYQDENSTSRFLGTQKESKTSQTEITLLDRVKKNPYTVVLFDEIEKANPAVLDLFLQLFDEGRLTSTVGETINFTNTIIICTSNIGSDILLESLQQDRSLWDEAKSRVIIKLKQSIRPELFNRFDNIVVFSPHSLDDLANITTLLLTELAQRVSEQNIALEWGDTIPMLIANKANEPGLGARPLKRYIQEKIEGKIATEILEKKLKAGSTVKIKESWII